MIELLSWPTPNGQKIHIALEELGLPYTVTPIDIGTGAQFNPDFLAVTPNHRIPAIIDHDAKDLTLFESGAILIYLAEKAGRLIPVDPAGRYACLQWLMFQMAGIGPMFGQYGHFAIYAPERIPYATERYAKEVTRLHGVLEARLSRVPYLAGDEYSIADIATFPWIRNPEKRGVNLSDYPGVTAWFERIDSRPAVQRGMTVMADRVRTGPLTDEARKHLFGAGQETAPPITPRVGAEIPRAHDGR